MNILEVIVGAISTIVGGYSSWWLLSKLWTGIVTSNWEMIVGIGILSYLLLGVALSLVIFGVTLFLGGLYD